MASEDWTTIMLLKTTRDRLKSMGRMHETYEGLLTRLMDDSEKLESQA